MRVLHVVGGYPTPENPHAQVFIQTQVESLRAVGVECDVLVLQGKGPAKYVRGKPQVRARLAEGAAGGGSYDLIHAHYVYCAVPSTGLGVPLVTSLLGSDLYAFPWRDGNEGWIDNVVHRALCRWVAKRSAAVIVKSRRMRDDLGLDAHVVPNGVNCDAFRPTAPDERAALREELGMREDTRYVLFGADPARPRKRFDLAQSAVRQAAARTPFPIALLPLHGRPHEEVARHMRAADLLILTSNLEGSPNVVKEAMASDLRVVSTDVGDVAERLEGVAGNRVCPDDSAESLGAAIAEVLAAGEPSGGREAVAPLRLEAVAERVRAIYESARRGAASRR